MIGLILIVFVIVDYIVYTSWKKSKSFRVMEQQRYKEMVERLKSFIPDRDSKGWVKFIPIGFAFVFCILLVLFVQKFDRTNKVTYEDPEFIGIAYAPTIFEKENGNHRYKLCDLLTSDCLIVDVGDSKVEWYAGHVLSKLTFINTGNYQLVDFEKGPYKIVRQDPKSKAYVHWKKLYGNLTRDDGYKQPVIANNCHNIDTTKGKNTDTECEGGEAYFTKDQVKEAENARPTRW